MSLHKAQLRLQPLLLERQRTAPGLTLIQVFLFVGLLLIPFSTGAGNDSVVIPFGLPFIALAAYCILLTMSLNPVVGRRELRTPVLLAVLHVSFILISGLLAPQLVATSARVAAQLVGFVIFVYVLSVSSQAADLRSMTLNRISLALISSGAILSCYFLFNFLVAIQANEIFAVLRSRTVGGLMSLPWGASNTIAAILIMPLFVALGTGYIQQGRGRLLIGGASLLMIVTILITQSRTAILAIVVGVIAYSVRFRLSSTSPSLRRASRRYSESWSE